MRKILFIIIGIVVMFSEVNAQSVPNGISYQAVARNDDGLPVANQDVVVEFTIFQGEPSNNQIAWQETHQTETDVYGLFSLIVGEGAPTFANPLYETFAAIHWETNLFYLKVRADFGSSGQINGLVDMGTTKILSVPYAVISDSTLHNPPIISINEIQDVEVGSPENGDVLSWNGNNWIPQNQFVNRDGSTDLTGSWIIDQHSIYLTNGMLDARKVKAYEFTLFNTVNQISVDFWLGGIVSGHTRLPTQLAVKTYVDHIADSTGKAHAYWTKTGNNVFVTDENVGIGTSALSSYRLDVNGTLRTTDGVVYSSDKRYKTNILPMQGVLAKLSGINGVYYNWKKAYSANTEKNQIGVLAQEIESEFPELVVADENGYKSVDYARLSAVLLQAVKEQNQIIERLEENADKKDAEIEQLKEQYKLLTKRLDMIEKLLRKQ